MPSDRVNRLLQLITLLQTRTGWDGQSLARELEVSTRTLFRDLNTLEQAGIPCRSDEGGGYRIQQGFFLPPVSLSASEVLGIMQLTRFVGQHRERPFHGQALSAIYKLISTVPEPLRSTCGQMLAHISTSPGARLRTESETQVFTQLQQAIDLGRACKVFYTSPVEDGPIEMELEPYLLHHANRAWYVLGKTDLHREVRMLKLVRIQSLSLLTRRFEKPRGFAVEQKLGNAWCMIPEGREHLIELEFSSRVATNVSEVRWHATQSHKLLADGRCLMKFRVDGLQEIAWWICGYADQVIVRKPQKLREIVARMHLSASALYDHA